MRCPMCEHFVNAWDVIKVENINSPKAKIYTCPSCNKSSMAVHWFDADKNTKELLKHFEKLKGKPLFTDDEDKLSYRPKHYEKGHDTFAWAEHKFDLKANLNICRFNIHKYNDREKGQDKRDFEKIIDYAQRALDLIQEDAMEVQGLE